jgi:pyruvate-formate lyase-activating enzyme
MEFEVLGHKINLKDYYCEQKGYSKCPVERPYVNMYVQFKGCNATCKFCNFMNCANDFNHSKFEQILADVSKEIEIRKISFTGGEPTLNWRNFYHALSAANDIIPGAFKVVNTNGLRISTLINSGAEKMLDSIALSRHHFDDDLNREILGYYAPSLGSLELIQAAMEDKYKFHFSCNLIQGYIDTTEKIYEYLEQIANIGIRDVGFVSLMKINDFAKHNYVDFEKINKTNDNLHVIKEWTNADVCKCNNYLYIPKNSNNDPEL